VEVTAMRPKAPETAMAAARSRFFMTVSCSGKKSGLFEYHDPGMRPKRTALPIQMREGGTGFNRCHCAYL
jgi:hypothetical protein